MSVAIASVRVAASSALWIPVLRRWRSGMGMGGGMECVAARMPRCARGVDAETEARGVLWGGEGCPPDRSGCLSVRATAARAPTGSRRMERPDGGVGGVRIGTRGEGRTRTCPWLSMIAVATTTPGTLDTEAR